MIVKSNGECGLECNECGATFWAGTLEFRDMIDDAKDADWTIKKTQEGEWQHFCPDCSEDL